MNYIVYKTKSGEILRTGTCPPEMAAIQASDGETVIEGTANDITQYIVDGVVTDYTEEQLLAKSSTPYGYVWDNLTMTAVKHLDDADISTVLAARARAKRNKMLTDCDWTQTDDQTPATKGKFRAFRQELRDVTKQAGFPNAINWPIPPT